MTLEDVKNKVEKVRSISHDDEMAHVKEDLLHQELLASIANGDCEDPKVCAEEALRTLDIDFARWCA